MLLSMSFEITQFIDQDESRLTQQEDQQNDSNPLQQDKLAREIVNALRATSISQISRQTLMYEVPEKENMEKENCF